MEIRQVTPPTFDCGYVGPSLMSSGCVADFLPFLTVGLFAGGGGYVSAGWLFWYVSMEWRGAK